MNETQTRFLALAVQYETLKEQLKVLREQLDSTMLELGEGSYLQDPVTGLVYKIIIPDGTFVSYNLIGYKRTAKEGERGGTILSKKEAEEAGFLLRK